MATRKNRPVTPSQRYITYSTFEEITRTTPEKSLLKPQRKTGGRNNYGRITSRHIGGGSVQHYRVIDFKRDKIGIAGRVVSIEYDPNRSTRIALINYSDGEKRYILAPSDLTVGNTIVSGSDVPLTSGNCLKLKDIPVGLFVHNVELIPGNGGQLARSAGTSAQLLAKEGEMVTLKLPSGEMRLIKSECKATLGVLGNESHETIVLGKAGRTRWLGRRSIVRGVVMNPVDHPHGGGEGKSGQGNPHPVTPWGKHTKGLKTRRGKKLSSKLILKRRK